MLKFYRHGGDTEVDVNDVSHSLEKVIPAREMEGTWQVDSFGAIKALARLPDEVSLFFYLQCSIHCSYNDRPLCYVWTFQSL